MNMVESLHIDVKQDDGMMMIMEVSKLERIFLIANFILELTSAAFDQLSSVQKPQKRPTPHRRRLNGAQEFTLAQIAAATYDFSPQNKVGVGRSFAVYRGRLPDVWCSITRTFDSKRAIFNDEDSGDAITSIVDFTVPKILANELLKVLDERIAPPELLKEAEALELVAYTALHCVNLEGNNRPSITNIVSNWIKLCLYVMFLWRFINTGKVQKSRLVDHMKGAKLQWNRETSLSNFIKATMVPPRNAQILSTLTGRFQLIVISFCN
ncbi:hypothetical protein GH714_013180 [Hevea brasiliensis]|uniref:Uncharacterized protein n=1 Tax=Hevea brasiliensis TaxID=3981 RepID=A0A6A6N3D4_HEVBR|nr:hypothetical protein GH714_013180 [Hevea brasiliensis]